MSIKAMKIFTRIFAKVATFCGWLPTPHRKPAGSFPESAAVGAKLLVLVLSASVIVVVCDDRMDTAKPFDFATSLIFTTVQWAAILMDVSWLACPHAVRQWTREDVFGSRSPGIDIVQAQSWSVAGAGCSSTLTSRRPSLKIPPRINHRRGIKCSTSPVLP